MRKGYALVEMLVVLAVFAMIATGLERFFRTFTYDLPKDYRLIQENCSLNNAVSHIRADVASAKALSQVSGDSNEPNMLFVKMPNGVVSYKFSNGRIIRDFVGSTKDAAAGDMVWPVPHGRIEWQVWSKGKTVYAVEVGTCIEDKSFGHTQKKMTNSNLFFVGALWEADQ
jgi:prepilin-type N-terminal cleavage/methylation domain-containing protein